MSYFTGDFISFFKDLSRNNHKEWFDRNRKRYEKSVKQPFQEFVGELIDRVRADDPTVDISPKDAIMRINRDIRFSKDKTPYHTYVAAIISAGGKKDKSVPGSYINLNSEQVTIYGGAYCPDKEQLYRLRTVISKNSRKFVELVSTPQFAEKFGKIQGEQNKRIPAEFRKALEKEPLIANKQFYFGTELDASQIIDAGLVDTFMDHYFAGKPVNEFLRKAMAG